MDTKTCIQSPQTKQNLTDDELKAYARVNRRLADDLLVRRYRRPLLKHAAYLLRNHEDAFDVTQEVLIRALHEERRYQDDFRIRPWLYRVTTNLCFNRLRDTKRRRAILETMEMPKTTLAIQPIAVFRSQQQEAILKAMDQLSAHHRTILKLRYYRDLSYAEIAEVLNVKLGTVMSRLSRARRRLMDVLPETELVYT